jgi:hypothetical protein
VSSLAQQLSALPAELRLTQNLRHSLSDSGPPSLEERGNAAKAMAIGQEMAASGAAPARVANSEPVQPALNVDAEVAFVT